MSAPDTQTVKRYDPMWHGNDHRRYRGSSGDMDEFPDGDYVTFEDYSTALATLAGANAEVERLNRQLAKARKDANETWAELQKEREYSASMMDHSD